MEAKTNSITFFLKNKTLMFSGKPEEIREMTEWMELCKEEELSEKK